MVIRYFEIEAEQSFCSAHVEAWRWSRLSKCKYCGEHRFSVHTLDRWMEHFMGKEAEKTAG